MIDFLLIAFAIFMLIKMMNKLRRTKEEEPAGPTTEELLTEIRDALKK